MLKITVLDNGVLFVHSNTGDSYEASIDKLEPDIREKFQVLMAADPGSSIYGVGYRANGGKYFYMLEEGDDLDNPVFLAADLNNTILRRGLTPWKSKEQNE